MAELFRMSAEAEIRCGRGAGRVRALLHEKSECELIWFDGEAILTYGNMLPQPSYNGCMAVVWVLPEHYYLRWGVFSHHLTRF